MSARLRSCRSVDAFAQTSLIYDQCIISPLAGLPRYSTAVKRCRQLSRSAVSACEQVGEHTKSIDSCRALLGSDGTAGGASTSAQSVDFELQPISSRLSSSGIS